MVACHGVGRERMTDCLESGVLQGGRVGNNQPRRKWKGILWFCSVLDLDSPRF